MATSVLTCMANGIIPIVSHETSIDVKDFGFLVKENQPLKMISKTKELINIAANLSTIEFDSRREKTLLFSKQFAKEGFMRNLNKVFKQL